MAMSDAGSRRDPGRDTETAIEEIERSRERLRALGRRTLGITGGEEAPPPLRRVVAGIGWYPLTALMMLILIDWFLVGGLLTLGPDISRTLGTGPSTIAMIFGLESLAMSLATFPLTAMVQRRPRRALAAVGSGFVWAVATIFAGLATGVWSLALFLCVYGAASGSVRSVHLPLLFDTYPAEGRARIYSCYMTALWGSLVLAPGFIGLMSVLNLTWRGVFLAMGGVSFVAVLFAVRLRDPGFGRWDTERLRAVVHEERAATTTVTAEGTAAPANAPAGSATADVPGTDLRLFEVVRRLLLIPTIRRLLVGYVALGVMLTPLITFFNFFLDEQWHQGRLGRSVFGVVTNAVALPFLLLSGPRIERSYARNPALVSRIAGVLLAAGVVLIGASALVPVFALMAAAYAVGSAAFAVAITAISTALGNVVPAQMRTHAASLSNIALYGAGGLVGQLFLSGIYDRSGPVVAIMALIIPGLVAGAVVFGSGRTINADLDRMVEEIVEHEEVAALLSSGGRLPMLSCRDLHVGYDTVKILFGVSFTVEEGEMVALLGTNGAGKSTLLKAVSGLALPTGGSVRLHGEDITYLDPRRRVDLGVCHVAGGHGTFRDLTVVENLRTYAYSLGRDRKAVERGLDATFEAFPRLAERRNQRASTMSGGENQMLALGRALIMRPRLLLIDELSLGLAPKIVGELLEMVRRINAEGAAVVLVEQSVNVALSVADHAYFMEKGEIRFDGSASGLLGRTDLLRAVFLQGATQAVTS